MPALFSAQRIAVLYKLFKHIFVAYVGAHHVYAEFCKFVLHRHVGMACAHHRISFKSAGIFQMFCQPAYYHVPVKYAPVFVHRDNPVGIPVKGKPEIRLVTQHLSYQVFGVYRSASAVDVKPVFHAIGGYHFGAEFFNTSGAIR